MIQDKLLLLMNWIPKIDSVILLAVFQKGEFLRVDWLNYLLFVKVVKSEASILRYNDYNKKITMFYGLAGDNKE